MTISDYHGEESLRPVKGERYLLLGILFSIPVFGWIYWLIKVFSKKTNLNERNFARQYLWQLLLSVAVLVILGFLFYQKNKETIATISGYINYFIDEINLIRKTLYEYINSIDFSALY